MKLRLGLRMAIMAQLIRIQLVLVIGVPFKEFMTLMDPGNND